MILQYTTTHEEIERLIKGVQKVVYSAGMHPVEPQKIRFVDQSSGLVVAEAEVSHTISASPDVIWHGTCNKLAGMDNSEYKERFSEFNEIYCFFLSDPAKEIENQPSMEE